eukprot:1157568-Pelagomonas_calceolata.AAC.6
MQESMQVGCVSTNVWHLVKLWLLAVSCHFVRPTLAMRLGYVPTFRASRPTSLSQKKELQHILIPPYLPTSKPLCPPQLSEKTSRSTHAPSPFERRFAAPTPPYFTKKKQHSCPLTLPLRTAARSSMVSGPTGAGAGVCAAWPTCEQLSAIQALWMRTTWLAAAAERAVVQVVLSSPA